MFFSAPASSAQSALFVAVSKRRPSPGPTKRLLREPFSFWNGTTYEEYIGLIGLQTRGKKKWRKSVLDIIELLQAAMVCDSVLLGGGNAKLMKDLPAHVVVGANSNAILGGLRLWEDPLGRKAAKI